MRNRPPRPDSPTFVHRLIFKTLVQVAILTLVCYLGLRYAYSQPHGLGLGS